MNYYNCYKIRFTPKVENFEDHEDHIEIISSYIGALISNGQIIQETASDVFFIKDEIFCLVTLIENSAANKENNNVHVNTYLEKITSFFDVSYEKIAQNANFKGHVCNCRRSWFILLNEFQYKESPVICGDCEGAVPLYRLPKILDSEEHYDTVNWFSNYKDIKNLWMSSLFDRFTYKQLNDPKSQLAKSGREICNAYEKTTEKPFYYKLFYTDVMPHKKPVPQNCPLCGEIWEVKSPNFIVDFKCDSCRLVADKNKFNK